MRCPACLVDEEHAPDCPAADSAWRNLEEPGPGQDLGMQDLHEALPATEPVDLERRRAEQDRLLDMLARTWRALPYLRLGQLLENARLEYGGEWGGAPDPYYLPDRELGRALGRLHDRHVRRGKTERQCS